MTLLDVPAVSGVPLMMPVLLFIARPEGKPVALQVIGAVPPAAVKLSEVYAFPTIALDRVGAVTLSGGELTVSVTAPEVAVTGAIGELSVIFSVIVDTPDAVGVPEMTPALESVRPAGRVPPAARLQVIVPVPPVELSVVL
jgi:hypothetical protein